MASAASSVAGSAASVSVTDCRLPGLKSNDAAAVVALAQFAVLLHAGLGALLAGGPQHHAVQGGRGWAGRGGR